MELVERFRGCMVGLAVGDALGYPVEFMNRSEIVERIGRNGITGFRRPWGFDREGLYSDDTQMSIAMARALLEADVDDLDDIMAHVSREFVSWARSPDNNRAPGQTCVDGARRLERGVHWFSSGDPYSKGCGAAMRVAPIGLVFHGSIDRLVEVARASSICTHGHPTALASGIAAAAAVAHAVRGRPPGEMLDAVAAALQQTRGEADYAEVVSHDPLGEQLHLLEVVREQLDVDPALAFDALGGGWVGEEAVAGALYAFLRSPDDFHETVLVAANATRTDEEARDRGRCDSDSIACIAGSISGAHNGLAGIPEEWTRGVEDGDLLLDLGEKLALKASTLAAARPAPAGAE